MDSFVDPESTARLIDAFVNSLDLQKYGVKEAAKEGRPTYDPKGLLKLYIYGCRNEIRSSRKLQRACEVNIEVIWLMGGAKPDFRTISDFRKDNIDVLKKLFHEFNRRLAGAVEWGFSSIDGSKFQANNSKNNNFTKNKLDDRIKWLDGHTDEYLRILKEMDEEKDLDEDVELTRGLVEQKLKEAQERLERYRGYQKIMEETGASQLSLTDADARLMKNKNGFAVSYNPQTAVDSETHLIRNFEMTNQVTDHGLIGPTMDQIRKDSPNQVLEAVADKGYEDTNDMAECLDNGIIPHVITDDGKDGYEIEIPYEEAEADITSTKPNELKKALHSGQIPEAYKDVISDIKVENVRRKVSNDTSEEIKSPYGTPETMKERAMQGYFVRDPERNLVYCPAGEILRQKCIKKGGQIRYANKNACRHCPNRNKCYHGKNEWKEVDFSKDKLEKPCVDWLKSEGRVPDSCGVDKKGKSHYEMVKIVRFFLKPDIAKTSKRMCLSEHPFGTIKRSLGFTYFLLNGIRKVTGEFALFCLGYNIERAKKLLGFDKMMELMTVT
ncbi:MAG: transposase [Lachnospiraceae bacterium]|jgi:transposase|nr:transposase [Lachnospiraceae bacterium]MCH3987320.1 transposase [Lachnospiraceae bacterium]MCH3987490.1 transposase [Lachnospiraceae bacterium]